MGHFIDNKIICLIILALAVRAPATFGWFHAKKLLAARNLLNDIFR